MLISAWKHQLSASNFFYGTLLEKTDSSAPVAPYEYDIVEEDGIIARMHLDDIRCIDKMRIIEKKKYLSVKTNRLDIENAVATLLTLPTKRIDARP